MLEEDMEKNTANKQKKEHAVLANNASLYINSVMRISQEKSASKFSHGTRGVRITFCPAFQTIP